MESRFEYKFDPRFCWWNKDHLSNLEYVRQRYAGKDMLSFLEVGVYEARTSVWLLDNVMTGKACTLDLIEPDPTENMMHNLSPHMQRVRIYQDYSENILPLYFVKGNFHRFDFIYIDGDHNAQGLLHDIVHAWKILKVDGILLLDDYEMEAVDPWHYISKPEFVSFPRINFTHPRIAIDAFLSIYRGMYEKVIDNFQIGVRKITDLGGKNTDIGSDLCKTKFSYISKG